jgi:GntR family transcriptional regulator
VLDLLLARGWPALSHSRTELISEAADASLAHALRIQRGAPLMKLVAQLFTADGQIVDYSISHFVPGYFRFHVVRRIAGA